jgi:hypothetical protein
MSNLDARCVGFFGGGYKGGGCKGRSVQGRVQQQAATYKCGKKKILVSTSLFILFKFKLIYYLFYY